MYLYQFNYVLRCPGCDSKLHNMWWHQLPTQESCGYFVCNTCIEFLRRIVKGPWEKFASKRDYRQFPLLSWRRSYYITRAILYKNNHSSAGKVYTNYFPTNTTVNNQGPFDGTSVVSSDDVISVSESSDDKDSTTVAHTSAENKSTVPHVDSTPVTVTTSDTHEEMPTDSFVGLLVSVTSGGPLASVTPTADATSIARAPDIISINPAAVDTSAVPAVHVHERILPPVPLFCDRGHNANACVNVTSDVPPASVTPAADVTSISRAPDVISIHPAAVNTSVVPAVHERILSPVPVPLFCDRGHNAKACVTPSWRMLQKQQQSLRPRKRKRKRKETLQEQIQVIQTSVHENQRLLMKILEQLQKQSQEYYPTNSGNDTILNTNDNEYVI